MKRHPEYWYFLFIPGYICCFFIMEHLVPSDCDYWVSWCRLDDYIPFLDFFVIPYVMWYPFLLVAGLGLMFRDIPEMKDRTCVRRPSRTTISSPGCWDASMPQTPTRT